MRRIFKVNKLVRDNLPERMTARGILADVRVMEQEEYVQELKVKLIEEAKEVAEATSHEEATQELADVLEVLYALMNVYNVSFDSIEALRYKKHNERGGFNKMLYCSLIDMDASHSYASYYASKPEKYPEIKE